MTDVLDDEVYGDTDPSNLPQDSQTSTDSSAGDGLPGEPVPGYPGLRAGVPGGEGALGIWRVDDPNGCAGLPKGYSYDSNGKLQLTPGFAQSHPKGPFDFGAMAHNIDWPGVGLDLGSIVASSVPLAGGGTKDILKAMPGMGVDAWKQSRNPPKQKE